MGEPILPNGSSQSDEKRIGILTGEKKAPPAYRREVALVKRFLELCTMEPGFLESFKQDPQAALAEKGLAGLDAFALQILVDSRLAEKYSPKACPEQEIPLLVRRYRAFVEEKIAHRNQMINVLCVPSNAAFRKWRQRQVNRCWITLGRKNAGLIHVPLTFELAKGCSVGCAFCGVAAGKLEKVVRYAEVGELWRQILKTAHDFIGEAAGLGTCYYASEPLDNPDYEQFIEDFYNEFGRFPQLTTARSMLRPERTRALLQSMQRQPGRIDRFSVLSLDLLHRIHQYFSAEELLQVELLPQFEEAPSCAFANAGRARKLDGKVIKDRPQEATISCISGFIVNMAEKSFRLITPCAADDAHPTGEILLHKDFFKDAADFADKLKEVCRQYMPSMLPMQQELRLVPGLSWEESPDGICFSCGGVFQATFQSADLKPDFYAQLVQLVGSGAYTGREVAAQLGKNNDLDVAAVVYGLNQLYQAGFLLTAAEMEQYLV